MGGVSRCVTAPPVRLLSSHPQEQLQEAQQEAATQQARMARRSSIAGVGVTVNSYHGSRRNSVLGMADVPASHGGSSTHQV